ncbi:hypothetical protein LguiB_001643 [Lonicera macranthoides]
MEDLDGEGDDDDGVALVWICVVKGVTHPGIALALYSLNLGVLMRSEANPPSSDVGCSFELQFLLPREYSSLTGCHILPPKGINVLVDTLYSVGSALIPFITTRSHLSTILSTLGSVQPGLSPGTSTLTALFLGAHNHLPRGSPILGLLWPSTHLTSEFLWDPKPLELEKKVNDGSIVIKGSSDILTMTLGMAEHYGHIQGLGYGLKPTTYFNLPRCGSRRYSEELESKYKEECSKMKKIERKFNDLQAQMKMRNETLITPSLQNEPLIAPSLGKELYKSMKNRIEGATKFGQESKAKDVKSCTPPSLVYLAHEKRPHEPRNFKPSAINALPILLLSLFKAKPPLEESIFVPGPLWLSRIEVVSGSKQAVKTAIS